eukprot:gene22926-31231_t
MAATSSTARKGLHVRRHTPLESVFDQENRSNLEVPSIKKDFDAVLKPSHTTSQLESTKKIETEPETILVTGGAGYIGTHTIVLLINAGYNVAVVDNLVNSSEEALERVKVICNCDSSRIRFYNIDLCDSAAFEKVFQDGGGCAGGFKKFKACIHFAGLKAVGESVKRPMYYYENNIIGTMNLLNLMDKYGCYSLVFSSSATVYGSAEVPISESTPIGTGISNPYGKTKFMIEEILRDYKKSKEMVQDAWSVVILRYFNPVGAHPSGLIGEDPNGPPNNLMPYIAQVAVGKREFLTIFGNDYPTKDGTGVRDYIHVMDLAEGHLSALRYMDDSSSGSGYNKCSEFNLGTGAGCSVMDMLSAMGKACGFDLPYKIGPRRDGDVAVCFADCSKAQQALGWTAVRTLEDMCKDTWNWQSRNPNGFK